MTVDTAESAKGITWDLTHLYRDHHDPKISFDLDRAKKRAETFQRTYTGKLKDPGLSPEFLRDAIREYEDIHTDVLTPYYYTALIFHADTQNEEFKAKMQSAYELWTEISTRLLFFRLELMEVEEARFQKLASAEVLSPYAHFLRKTRNFRPFTLSEAEEKVVKQKDMGGKHAFAKLFTELTGSFKYRLSIDGGEKELTGPEIMSYLFHEDGALRERAMDCYLRKHEENGLVLTFLLNTLMLDHASENRLRGFEKPIDRTNLDNEIRGETVESLMAVTEKNYPLAQRYFRLKAKLLGVPRLKNSDINAPIGDSRRTVPFGECRELILGAFTGFDAGFGSIAREFFDRRWIDAEIRPGKDSGAFCMGMLPSLNPFIFMNYTGNLRDVSTLAHELGHGIHFYLSRKQSPVNFDTPLTLAETASVFCEMIVTKALLQTHTDRETRIAILCRKLEDIILTTFRQNALTRFELRAHEKRGDGLLAPQEICDLWWKANGELFGDSVEMIPSYRWGWSYIPHFIHSRFYCYAYVFGELLVLSLFRTYQRKGDGFVPGYRALLESGGSDSPDELLFRLRVNVNEPSFWQGGYDLVEEMLTELESLVG